jgi:hypothetical protein
MWAVLDLFARLICLGGIALVVWFVYQIVREPSAPVCIECGAELFADEVATCFDCFRVFDV